MYAQALHYKSDFAIYLTITHYCNVFKFVGETVKTYASPWQTKVEQQGKQMSVNPDVL